MTILILSTPQGYYSIERMLKSVRGRGGQVKACGSCVEARGLQSVKLIDGVEVSDMSELARWGIEADRVFTF